MATTLDHKFGTYLLTIACRKCKHVRIADPHSLAQILGWEITLAELAKQLRCSSCDAEDCELTPKLPAEA